MRLRAAVARWRSALDARAADWVRRRQGEDRLPVELQRRRLYILPTRGGVGFALMLLAMLFAGMNYANSLALMVTFALGSFALVGMNHCHRNLLGLRLVSLEAQPTFAGEPVRIALALENPGVERHDLAARGLGASAHAPSAAAAAITRLELCVPTQRRGRLHLSRLQLATSYPFGLFRCWTWVHLPREVLVYPRPHGTRPPPTGASGREGSRARHESGRDELRDLRSFRDGDSPRQVAWKTYARGMPLLVKEYSGASAESTVFDFAALADLEVEARLSQLCRWVLDAEVRGSRYALWLPERRLEADCGAAHRARCLEALALHGLDAPVAGPVAPRRASPPAASSVRPVLWTIAVFVAAMLLHVDRLPPWCSVAILALAAWRAATALGRRALPRSSLRLSIGALLLLAIVAQFSTITGLAAGTALLAAMGALKLMETAARRDCFVVIGVSLFLVIAACLDRQSLLRLPLYVGAVWLVCTALAIVGTPQVPLATRTAVSIAGRSLAFALPMAIVLFLLFPRLQGEVWALPGNGAGVTGLSNEMSPGAISELSNSYEPAFRVRFSGPAPAPRELYWRGPVMQNFDGYSWRREPRSFYRQAPLRYLGPPYRYRITLEPHQRNWWFALDTPTASPDRNVIFTYDYQLVALRAVTQPTSYDLLSHTQVRATEPLSPLQRRLALQLPAGRNARSVALARELRAGAADDAAFVRALLDLFRDGGYTYTLTPPRLDLDSIDDFLFRTRQGFCGHYASAFAMLARAAGLPARIVTGYQGGEWNPIGSYFIVRQSDAHAWAEVWLDGRGWSRVDPTAVVAPDRLNRGFFESMPSGVSQTDRMLREIGWLADARLAWDTVNTWWKDQVIEFDLRAQLGLLSRLGFDSPRLSQLGALLAAALVAWLAWLALHLGRMERPRDADPLGRAYRRLCARLGRVGLSRRPDEGPLDYALRIDASRPQLGASVRPLLEQYAALRYGPAPQGTGMRDFARGASRLRLRGESA